MTIRTLCSAICNVLISLQTERHYVQTRPQRRGKQDGGEHLLLSFGKGENMDRDPIQSYRNCYAFPQLGDGYEFGLFRFSGTGLSNLLFTWARCLVMARRYGLKRISPTWPQFSHVRWVRREPDKRTYHDLFYTAPDEVSGIDRLRLLATKRWVPESQLGRKIPEGSIIVFRKHEGFLAPSVPYQELVCPELLQIVRPEHKRAIDAGFSPDVAIHVRLGDFINADPSRGNTRIDLSWYVGILNRLRENLGSLQVSLFSDGTDEELAELLSLDGVRRITFGSSIADIIGLSRARIFIASGSTFSMWASYLGQMPTVWFPKRLHHPILRDSRREIMTLLDLPQEFIEQCAESLERRSEVAP